MDKQYYFEYFTLEREHWWFVVRGKILLERMQRELPSIRPLKILNVGAATGRSTELLSQFGDVTSLEYDETCRDFTVQKLGIDIVLGSVTELPFDDDSFDVVCAFDVIEHVHDDQLAVLEEMIRVCKPEGHVCVTVPACMSVWSHHDVVNHHYRRYLMGRVAKLFEASHGEVRYKSYFNSLLFPPIWAYRNLSRFWTRSMSQQNSGSDFSVTGIHSMPNKIAGSVFDFERRMLNLNIKFPLGISILFLWQKQLKAALACENEARP